MKLLEIRNTPFTCYGTATGAPNTISFESETGMRLFMSINI
jgi:hypothetical protein